MSTENLQPQAALYAALAKAQGEFKPLAKNREVMITMKSGGKYKFRYADIEAINNATRTALAANGLAILQPVQTEPDGATRIDTILVHAAGGLLSSSVSIKPLASFGDPKDFGATVTYVRRYAISALLNVAADDDLDENGEPSDSATGAQQQPATTEPPSLPVWPKDAFDTQMVRWKKAVWDGIKTRDDILAMAETKGVLTPEQQRAIKALEIAPQAEGVGA